MDMLSRLPDEVICHILSFLPTKSSVQASVLSKRWRFLWVRVPLLDFSLEGSSTKKIVNEVLLQHKHDIHTFRLYVGDLEDDDIEEEEFQSWIVNATTRSNILELFIGFDQNGFDLPHCLFTCKTLVDLCLEYCGVIPMSGICFPALTKLKLERVDYESHESLAHLVSSCPVLEELIVEGRVLGHCCVSSPTLTRLVLELTSDELAASGVKLDTPALRYLWIQFFMPGPDILSIGVLDSLIEAYITLFWEEDDQDNLIYSRNVLAFVGKLYNVKFLKLWTCQIAVVHDSALAIKFNNLTRLNLHCNFVLITFLLENADNLQDLRLVVSGIAKHHGYWMEPKRVPACLISHLQTIKVCQFGCSEEEFDMTRYILMNAKVLKRMKIRTKLCERDCEKKLQALKRLAMFERGSQECQLLFD